METGDDEGSSNPIHARLIIDFVIATYSIAWLCWFLYGYRKKLGPVHIMDLNFYAEWAIGMSQFFDIACKKAGLGL